MTGTAEERTQMIAELKAGVVPHLRTRGFLGSFPHFRRPVGTRIDLLTFQFDKYGGGFVVEIAHCPSGGVTMPWGKHVPPGKVTAQQMERRLRLGAAGEDRDHWFRYDNQEGRDRGVFKRLADQVVRLLDDQAERWWREA